MQPEAKRGWRWYGAQAVLLVVSLVGLSVPFFLFEPKSAAEARLQRSLDAAEFSVSIAFRDASLDLHLGLGTDSVTRAQVFRVQGKTRDEAITQARQLFDQSASSAQMYTVDGQRRVREADPKRPVQILDIWAVAEQKGAALAPGQR